MPYFYLVNWSLSIFLCQVSFNVIKVKWITIDVVYATLFSFKLPKCRQILTWKPQNLAKFGTNPKMMTFNNPKF